MPSARLTPATEQRIEAAVDRLLTGRTAVLIAHRLSSLSRVDQIAVVDGGRIVEYGPRRDLAADPDSRFTQLLVAAGLRPAVARQRRSPVPDTSAAGPGPEVSG
jgi:ATP-binding cassette, subfamily B, bacterial